MKRTNLWIFLKFCKKKLSTRFREKTVNFKFLTFFASLSHCNNCSSGIPKLLFKNWKTKFSKISTQQLFLPFIFCISLRFHIIYFIYYKYTFFSHGYGVRHYFFSSVVFPRNLSTIWYFFCRLLWNVLSRASCTIFVHRNKWNIWTNSATQLTPNAFFHLAHILTIAYSFLFLFKWELA